MRRECKLSNCYIMGPTGRSESIEVRNTTTLSPDMDAKVIDTYSSGKHILDFKIPREYDGNVGPTGPEFARAFGYKYSDVGTVINFTKQVEDIIPLNRTGTSLGIDVSTNDYFIILEKGIYKLNIIFQVLLRMIRRFLLSF